jgi:indole-3-glycerol phosphate synthase
MSIRARSLEVAPTPRAGIETTADVARFCSASIDGIRVGTALMTSLDQAARLRELRLAAVHTKGALR